MTTLIALFSFVSLTSAATIDQDFKTPTEAANAFRSLSSELRAKGDRRSLFSGIYSLTIQATAQKLERKEFENPAWVEELVVNYANLYRRTISAELKGQRAELPRGWQMAFRLAQNRDNWSPTLDSVYTINVHIARDLVQALYLTPTNFRSKSVLRDYNKITTALNSAMPKIFALFNSYGRDFALPSWMEQSVMIDWISHLRAQAWNRTVKYPRLTERQLQSYLKQIDNIVVAQNSDWGITLPIFRE